MTSPATRLRALAPVTALLLAGTALTGCAALGGDDSPASGREVVAAFYPLAWAAERVAGEHLEITNLTAAGTEPHDLELAAKDIATLSEARVVIHESDLQPAVDAAIDEHAQGTVVDAAEVVQLQEFAEHTDEAHAEEEEHADEAHGDEAHGDEAHGEEEHGEDTHAEDGHPEESHDEHDHGDLDPHFWHDPLLMAEYADSLADTFAEVDPDHAADFAANAAALREDLEAVDAEFTEGLAGCERDLVVVNHDAFGYLARYGLHMEPITGFSPDATADAATLARLRTLIKDEGITTVFAERLVAGEAIPLARAAGVRTGVLDPIEGLTPETKGEDYLSLMRANLESIREANGC
jgi:zinc transport system substrate-binding protein